MATSVLRPAAVAAGLAALAITGVLGAALAPAGASTSIEAPPAIESAATASAPTAGAHAAAEERFVDKINAERRRHGRRSVTVDTELTRVARAWTPRMIADDRLSHNDDLAAQVGADWRRLAENVGRSWEAGATDAQLVDRLHRAFMDSDGHRRNILLADVNRVGVGVARADDGIMYVTVVLMAAAGAQDQVPIEEAVRVSGALFDGDAAHVVLARSEVFADALGGTGLAGGAGPVLFTPGPRAHDPDPVLHPRTRAEIDRALGGSGRVYLLGGTGAVSTRAQDELADAGYDVVRLAGPSRVETAVAVAEEIVRRHGRPDEVLLVRADDWADAVSGGAYAADRGVPVLVTGSHELHPRVAAFLDRHDPRVRWALGGTAALAHRTVAAAGADRVAGPERTATAVEVARRLWGRTAATAGDHYSSAPAHGATAWASALALAPWSAAHEAPQLLVGDAVPGSVHRYLSSLGYDGQARGEVFAAQAVPGSVVEELASLVARP